MNKEFLKMQKLAGLITEGQYKEEINEAESDLIILLYSLRNSINSENKEESLSKLEDILSIARDMEDAQLNEMIGDIEDTPSPDGDFNPNADAEADNADDSGYNDKVAYLFNVLQGAWNMGKNNNKINNLDDFARSVIDDLETKF